MKVCIDDDFDMDKIARSGQCFRVRQIDNGAYRFVTKDKLVYVRKDKDNTYSVSCDEKDWKDVWEPYFDLSHDYKAGFDRCYGRDEFIDKAMDAGRGLRILRQDPWEMLISFIISQRKNIPAIKSAIETISEKYGKRVDFGYEVLHLFPTPSELSMASADELSACGLGYRVPYILDAIAKVLSGMLDFDTIGKYDDEGLLEALQYVKGVGKKVSNCIALFAFGRYSLVPIDVWIERAIYDECEGRDPFPLYGKDAGIIQQYVFYYMTQITK